MVKMQHRDRRGGGITVGDPPTRYMLDSDGIVEVTEEHAQMLSGTAMWREPGFWPAIAAASAPPPPESPAGRRPRTREELAALARAEGIAEPEEKPKPPEPTPVVANAEDSETIEVSPSMTLEQLRGVAKRLGLDVPRGIKKAELFELIKAQGEG
jgi:hypothetical protein